MDTNIFGFSVKTIVLMAFNFASSVGIILMNKMVFKEYGFSYATALTAVHFVITFIGLHALSKAGHFEVKYVEIKKVIPLVFAFCGFVVFNNLSLQYNSVGCYQLMKVLTTPVIAVIQYLLYGVNLDNKLKVALLPICVGVIMATVSDIDLTFMGAVYGAAGLASTSFYQLWVKTKQTELGLDSYQLLYYQAPLSAIVVLLFVPVFDQVQGAAGILAYQFSATSIFWIAATGVMAFCVNLSIYLVIGNTSPISYNVLGHFKLSVILFSGWMFMGEDMNTKKTIGTVLTFAGVVWYTTLKQNIDNEWKQQQQAAAATAKGANAAPPSTANYRPVNTNEAAVVIAADNSLADEELGVGGSEMEALSNSLKSVETPAPAKA